MARRRRVAGWCVADRLRTLAAPARGQRQCSTTAHFSSPLVVTSYGGPVAMVITAPGVAAVKVSHGPTILTRADSHLPFGFRAAVFRWSGSYTVNGGPPSLTALDARGRRMRGGVSPGSSLPTLGLGERGRSARVSGACRRSPTGAPAAPPHSGCVTAGAAGSVFGARRGERQTRSSLQHRSTVRAVCLQRHLPTRQRTQIDGVIVTMVPGVKALKASAPGNARPRSREFLHEWRRRCWRAPRPRPRAGVSDAWLVAG